jgi:hypothetical protein
MEVRYNKEEIAELGKSTRSNEKRKRTNEVQLDDSKGWGG